MVGLGELYLALESRGLGTSGSGAKWILLKRAVKSISGPRSATDMGLGPIPSPWGREYLCQVWESLTPGRHGKVDICTVGAPFTKMKDLCYRLETYTKGHYGEGASSGKVWGHGTQWFGSKVDKYTKGVSTSSTLEGRGLTPQTCNSHRKFVLLSSPPVGSLKGLGLAVPEQVRQGANRVESTNSPRRRAMNL